MIDFNKRLSDETVYRRFSVVMPLWRRVDHVQLVRLCHIDYRREMVLVAVESENENGRIVGVANAAHEPRRRAEFAITIEDDRQHAGIGTALLQRLVEVERREGIKQLYGQVQLDNQPMLNLCHDLGFTIDEAGIARLML